MPSWFVFEPAKTAPDTLEAADKAVFVKDGFSLGAFLVTPVWLLWRRMWLVFLAWLVLQVVFTFALRIYGVDETLRGIVSLLVSLCFALEANALRSWTMRRQGWRFTGIACGQNLEEAEQRHFEARSLAIPAAANQPPTSRNTPSQEFPGPWSSALGRSSGTPGVLGVFPEPQGSKP